MKKSLMSLFCVSLLALLPACWGDKKPCCGSHCETTTETETKVVEEVVTPTEQTEAPAETSVVETVETTTEEAK